MHIEAEEELLRMMIESRIEFIIKDFTRYLTILHLPLLASLLLLSIIKEVQHFKSVSRILDRNNFLFPFLSYFSGSQTHNIKANTHKQCKSGIRNHLFILSKNFRSLKTKKWKEISLYNLIACSYNFFFFINDLPYSLSSSMLVKSTML